MSEQSNTDTVRGVYDAFLRNDIPAVLNTLTDDVEWNWYGPAAIPFAGTRHGHDEVLEWFRIIGDTVEFHQFEPGDFEYVAQGDTVVVRGFEKLTAKMTGRAFEQQWARARPRPGRRGVSPGTRSTRPARSSPQPLPPDRTEHYTGSHAPITIQPHAPGPAPGPRAPTRSVGREVLPLLCPAGHRAKRGLER